MSLEPLFSASLPIHLHVIGVVPSLLIGPFILWRKKGTPLHKALGKIWVSSMALAVISSFFIQEIRMVGPFSPIHLLSIFTAVSLFLGVQHARAGRIEAHRQTMQGLYFGALIVAGAFTLLPGRVLNRMIFSNTPSPDMPFIAIGLIGILLVGAAIIARTQRILSFEPRQETLK